MAWLPATYDFHWENYIVFTSLKSVSIQTNFFSTAQIGGNERCSCTVRNLSEEKHVIIFN